MRLISLVGLTGLVMAGAAVALVQSEGQTAGSPDPHEKNPISVILEIGETDGDVARAKALADEVRERYATMKALTLTAVETAYWCDQDEPDASLDDVPQRKLCHIEMSQTWDTFDTSVAVKKEVVLEHSLRDGTVTEYNRRSRKCVSYPIDGHVLRLHYGIPSPVLCLVGMFRRPWIGPEDRFHKQHLSLDPASLNAISVWANRMAMGEYMGRHANGFLTSGQQAAECDLILSKRQARWDVFYLDRGLLVSQVMLEFEEYPERPREVFIKAIVFGHTLDLNGVLAGAGSERGHRAVEKGGELAIR